MEEVVNCSFIEECKEALPGQHVAMEVSNVRTGYDDYHVMD
jgi:hypothetical protein